MSQRVEDWKSLLEAEGYVVVKAASYRRAQERQRIAEALLRSAEERIESVETWARNCLSAERAARDRCSALVGFAMEHGTTLDDLQAFNAEAGEVAGEVES